MRSILFYISLMILLSVTNTGYATSCKLLPAKAGSIAVSVDCRNMTKTITEQLGLACRYYQGAKLVDLVGSLPASFVQKRQHTHLLGSLIKQRASLKGCQFAGNKRMILTFDKARHYGTTHANLR